MGYVIIDLPQRLIWKEVVHWILRTKIKGLKKFVRMPKLLKGHTAEKWLKKYISV